MNYRSELKDDKPLPVRVKRRQTTSGPPVPPAPTRHFLPFTFTTFPSSQFSSHIDFHAFLPLMEHRSLSLSTFFFIPGYSLTGIIPILHSKCRSENLVRTLTPTTFLFHTYQGSIAFSTSFSSSRLRFQRLSTSIPSSYHRNSPHPQIFTAPRTTSMVTTIRIGHGYDLHRLEPNLPLILGGVELQHDRGCAAHSDGDAVYHCVVDAVLGALAMPDIGQLFSDKDPQWKGARSDVFMTATQEIMLSQGYQLMNLDVTIILEKPKLSPHKDKIRANIASLLKTQIENVNVKAKTHEKVDAVGENRAVEVHAVALLDKIHDISSTFSRATEQAVDLPSASDPFAQGTKKVFEFAQNRATQILSQIAENKGDIASTLDLSSNQSMPHQHVLDKLADTIHARRSSDVSTSWTAKLLSKGPLKIAQKVGEEAVEVAIEAARLDSQACIKESADLIYHLLVLWESMGIQPHQVWHELSSREAQSGISEKQSRHLN